MRTIEKNNDISSQQTVDEASIRPAADRQRSRRRLRLAAAIGAALLIPYAMYADESPLISETPAIELPAGESLTETDGEIGVSPLPATPINLVQAEPEAAAPATKPATLPALPPMAVVTPVVATTPTTLPADAVASLFQNKPADGPVKMLVGKSLVLRTRAPFKRMSLTQPEVVGDNLVDPTSILLTAKKPGVSQLIVWDDKDQSEVLDIVVDVDLKMLTELVKTNFPTANVELSAVNGTLVARGRVPNLQTAEQITEMLTAYGKVLNFLEMAGGDQVMLQVRFAEVSRSASTALGVNFGMTDGTSRFGSNVPGGGPYSFVEGEGGLLQRAIGSNVQLFGGGRIGSTEFDIFLSALRKNSLLRMLAEPNLATLSGKQAEFLAGGEVPIPVVQPSAGVSPLITVEYKPFGVQLTFMPTVTTNGIINLRLTPSVSELDFNNAVIVSNFRIPALTKREARTTIELRDGQSFAIAGLLQNDGLRNISQVPWIGAVPVLGALFRSSSYQANETDLVVIVTPQLVQPAAPGQRLATPMDGTLPGNDVDLFLLGQSEVRKKTPEPIAVGASFRGPSGYIMPGDAK